MAETYEELERFTPGNEVAIERLRSDTEDAMCARFREVLREHWLTGIECNHEARTDRAACFCGQWRGMQMPNVASAVNDWIAHVMGQL